MKIWVQKSYMILYTGEWSSRGKKIEDAKEKGRIGGAMSLSRWEGRGLTYRLRGGIQRACLSTETGRKVSQCVISFSQPHLAVQVQEKKRRKAGFKNGGCQQLGGEGNTGFISVLQNEESSRNQLQNMWIYLLPLKCTLKMVNFVGVFYHNYKSKQF